MVTKLTEERICAVCFKKAIQEWTDGHSDNVNQGHDHPFFGWYKIHHNAPQGGKDDICSDACLKQFADKQKEN